MISILCEFEACPPVANNDIPSRYRPKVTQTAIVKIMEITKKSQKYSCFEKIRNCDEASDSVYTSGIRCWENQLRVKKNWK